MMKGIISFKRICRNISLDNSGGTFFLSSDQVAWNLP